MSRTTTLRGVAEVSLGRQRSPQHDSGPHLVPYLRAANVKDGLLDLNDVKHMNFSPAEQVVFSLRAGDVLITEGSGSLATVGASAVWRGEIEGTVCFQNTLLRLRPRAETTDGRFLEWWARFAFGGGLFASIATGANIYHISAERVRALPIDLPLLERQRRIADFLDIEIDRVDRLAKLVSTARNLMLDRRLAVIDSRLPDDAVTRLKYLSKIFDTEHKTAPHVPGGGYWIAGTAAIKSGHLVRDLLYETSVDAYSDWTRRTVPCPGDLLLTREAPVGEATMISETDPLIAIGQRMVLIRPNNSQLDGKFLLWTLLSNRTKLFIGDVTQGSLHPHLNMGEIGNIPVSAISIARQREISSDISREVAKISEIVNVYTRMLGLLAERRQSLITAAVTGQLDVTTARGGESR